MDRRTIAACVAVAGVVVAVALGQRAMAGFAAQFEERFGAAVAAGNAPSEAQPENATYLDAAEVATLFGRPTAHRQVSLERLDVVVAGSLLLPSGQVAAGDVFLADTGGLDRRLPAGPQSVSLLVARFDDGDTRVAAAVLGTPDKVVRWLPAYAVQPGEAGADSVPGYAVDSGTAAFASREAAESLANSSGTEEILDRLTDNLDRLPWTEIRPTGDGRTAGMIAFGSGYGDGVYPLWWGLDATNSPVALLTDFGVLVQGSRLAGDATS